MLKKVNSNLVNYKGGIIMVKHTGGKVGKAGKVLSSKKSSKPAKSKAGQTLKKHQDKKH